MSTRALRPWTDLVKLHPDVEAGALTEAVFAIDLGAIAAGDPNVPVVNRDPASNVALKDANKQTGGLALTTDALPAAVRGSGFTHHVRPRKEEHRLAGFSRSA